MTPLDGLAHRPLRPIWLCRLDANPWPCGEAKLALLTVFADDRPALLALLSTLQREAEDHLTQLDSGRSNNLTDRFLSWAQPPDH
ncbi:flavin reductase [Micromonospora sp. WMMD734]|uniref:Flavin reductase n=1 Tax=Micromonospora humidisoli TaxID=2807622 RepID=A0ABS2JAS0_9ACTN|nr:flavin reductase [Micromonospora humidisoli]MBM7083246.1 flavin reductase [Micromonospora humidisoli]